MELLHLGNLEADEGWFKRGGGTTLGSKPTKIAERREMVVIGVLIEHPTEGLILFETGPGKDYPTTWGAPLNDVFAQVNYHPDQELEKQIEKTGHKLSDIKTAVMGHLHVDHAGGLELFRGTDVPIYVHEQELKHAFYSVASKTDIGVYFPQHLTFDLNWTPFHGDFLEITQGLTLRHAPGHTPSLCILQANLKDSGTWIFTTDQYHVHENFEASHPQGWLARDHDNWVRSHQMVNMLQKRTDAKMVFGHCKDTFDKYKQAPHAYT